MSEFKIILVSENPVIVTGDSYDVNDGILAVRHGKLSVAVFASGQWAAIVLTSPVSEVEPERATGALEPTRLPDGEIRLMSQDTQSPSLGRVVLYTPYDPDRGANGAHEYVAIIGQVWNDPHVERPYVNLLTFPPFAGPEWQGSVQEAINPGDPRSWRFPPRVTAKIIAPQPVVEQPARPTIEELEAILKRDPDGASIAPDGTITVKPAAPAPAEPAPAAAEPVPVDALTPVTDVSEAAPVPAEGQE